MASKPELRGDAYRVRWRLGGAAGAPFEQAKFVLPEGATTKSPAAKAAYELAVAAKALAEAHGHRITGDEVTSRVLGLHQQPRVEPTLRKFAAEWAKDRAELEDIQPDTLTEYVRTLEVRVLPKLGHLYLSEIDEPAIKDWLKWLKVQRVRRSKKNPQGEVISPNSVRRAHTILHQVLAAAVPAWLERNPAARPAGSRKTRVGLPKVTPFEGMYLEPWEVDLIHSRCSPAIADIWFVLVRTGLRLGELLVLRPQDVTLTGANPVIRVRRALKAGGMRKDGKPQIGPPKSEKSRRDVTISSEVVKVLERRCAGKRPRDLLFPTPYASSPVDGVWQERNLFRQQWLPAVAEAMRCPDHPPPTPAKPRRGCTRKLRPDEVSDCACPGVLRRRPRLHDGRHTHASDCIRANWQPIEVQHRLGHASYSTTVNIYFHLWQNQGDRDRLDRMERRGGRRLSVARQRALAVDDEAA
ncbi:tyrosine-type recombinase/integrase [Phytohabitans houttuyneae]|uniref:Site-specific integrase n=1 Tax=Phytohabitans houttuyneae TaxID=1076126 RepID=A0A6V8KB08_9ACTN|nr:site-specific integrase [Phytohabitans houttuyneae]GFJ79568.1 site-specific integrase [Phytohabitans houttuyneae]